jgi:hypothetical protein
MHHEMIQSLLDSQRYDHTAMGGAAAKTIASAALARPDGRASTFKQK